MPAISLVVCLHRERDFLERLLRETSGLFDDLVVIHDGPESAVNDQVHTPDEITETPPAIDYSMLAFDSPLPSGYHTPPVPARRGSIHELTTSYGGRYFEGPRCFQQEPHWPFAWSRAKYDWILRLDADEFPSAELKAWLVNFHAEQDVERSISGYTCIWPVWNGIKPVTQGWPSGRNFLFTRERVRFYGMVEQTPIADDHYEFLPLILRHEPRRKSHGLANILLRKQGRFWRTVIAQSLLYRPQDLPHWRWKDNPWPDFWVRLRQHPIRAGTYFLLRNTAATLRQQWRSECKLMPLIAVATPLHHFLIGLQLFQLRRNRADAQVSRLG
jgi:hypothetical protein